MADSFDENVKTLMEVTGLDLDGAKKVLKFRENNLDAAINYVLDGNDVPEIVDDDVVITKETSARTSTSNGRGPSTSSSANSIRAGPSIPAILDEEEVRAPIPPKRDIMILPEEDNFRYRKRRTPAQNLCPLRNFAREGQLLEEELFSATGDVDYPSASSSRRKRVRLEDIFRPPVDLCFCGPFQSARDFATEHNRWLIVNVQDHTEFLCQCLNRDVWSNMDLKSVIKSFFIFWQVSIDNSEGARFKTFYSVDSCPHVCIIDPRTGEHKTTLDSSVLKPDLFIKQMYVFLKENGPYPSSDEKIAPNGLYNIVFKDVNGVRMKMDDDSVILASPAKSFPSTSGTSRQAAADNVKVSFEKLTEEEQIELAIKQSLSETERAAAAVRQASDCGSDDGDDIETFTDDEDSNMNAPSSQSYEKHLGSDSDPKTKLQLRLPDGGREMLEWPSTSKIVALKIYLKQKYPELTREKYKIINTSTFPKRNILDLNEDTPFNQCDLHPVCILYIHQDN